MHVNLRDKGLRLQLVLTTACNNSCYFCDYGKPIDYSTSMSNDTLNSIYQVALKHGNCTFVTLTGGEAIMHPEFNNIVLKFREMFPNIHIQVNTNFQHNLFERLPYNVVKNIDLLSITLHDQYVHDVSNFFKKVKDLESTHPGSKQITLMLSEVSYKEVLNIYDKYKDDFNVILKYVYGEEEKLKLANNPLISDAMHLESNTIFKNMLCNNEWVIIPSGGYYRCWDDSNTIINNINNLPELKSISLCTISSCRSALFTDKGYLSENYNRG